MNIVVPELGESVVQARVAQWRKREGEPVSAGEPVVELETDKVNVEVAAPRAGVLSRIEHQEGADVHPGDVLAVIEEGAATVQPAASVEAASAEPAASKPPAAAPASVPAAATAARESARGPEPAPPAQNAPATPVAKRMAEEHDIDLAGLTGTGPRGRITKEDVQRVLEGRTPAPEDRAPQTSDAEPEATRTRMSLRRATIARRLVEAQHATASLTTFNDVDMTAVMDLRRRTKEGFQARHGVGLGIISFFVKAAVAALREFPMLNAEIQGDEIVYKRHYDIGVAMAADEGLVVPVVRDAARLSLAEIETAVTAYAKKVQERTLGLDDLRGGTFTITNGGVFGSLLSTPILNPPQVGILGLHRIEDRAVVREGQIVIRQMMYLALTYDHRIVDGREAVLFLRRVRELVEDPGRLLLDA